MNTGLWKEPYPWMAAGLLLVALGLRLFSFDESVWLDELFTSNLKVGDPVVLLNTLYSDIHPPAYFVFMHFWNAVFGDSEVALRIPPLICGIASILLVLHLGTTLVNPQTGMLAATMLTLSPVHIWYSQEGRPYSAGIFMVLVTVSLFYRLGRQPVSRWWSMLYLLSVVGTVFVHYYLIVLACILTLLALFRKMHNRKKLVFFNLVALGLFVCYFGLKYWFSHVDVGRPYLRSFGVGECWDLFFRWFTTGNSLTPLGVTGLWRGWSALASAIAVGSLLVTAFGVLVLLRRPDTGEAEVDPVNRRSSDLALYMLMVPVLLFGLRVAGFEKFYIERSALPALPFFLLILAAGICGPGSRIRQSGLTAAGVVLGVVLTSFLTNRHETWTVYKPNPDWRKVAAFFSAEMGDWEQTRALYIGEPTPLALTYYDARIQEEKLLKSDPKKLDRLQGAIRKALGEDGWLGSWLLNFVQKRFDELDETRQQARDGMKLAVSKLETQASPVDDAKKRKPRIFYVLCRTNEDRSVLKIRSVIQDKRCDVLQRIRVASLDLYVMKVKEGE